MYHWGQLKIFRKQELDKQLKSNWQKDNENGRTVSVRGGGGSGMQKPRIAGL